MTANTLLLLALGYVGALFLLASLSERRRDARPSSPWVYTLTLAVYCSSWTFYGAVGSMTADPWSHTPIYLGPILLFLLGRPVINRLIDIGHRQRVTSIADFLGARFGKRRAVSAVVSLICLVAVLPYIALQLRALDQVWGVVTARPTAAVADGNATLLAAIGLAVFAVLFGVRRLGGNERQHGLMHAMAAESLVKLVAFVAVAALSVGYLMTDASPSAEWPSMVPVAHGDHVAHLLVSALAILFLPRQFHVTVVELEQPAQARHIHWAMPLYLGLFMILAVPIAIAGQQLFAGQLDVAADTYVQRLPMALDSGWVSAAAFLGGISAATSMVLVATVSVSIMITNEILTPLLFRIAITRSRALLNLGSILRWSRQLTVIAILLVAWLLSLSLAGSSNLADIGFLSFLGTAQLAPALLLGLYWHRAHGMGVLLGMLAGTTLWFLLGLLPLLQPGDTSGSKLGFAALTAVTLGTNTLLSVVLSWRLPRAVSDERQASVFMDTSIGTAELDNSLSPIRIAQLRNLVEPLLSGGAAERFWRVLETSYQQRLLPADRAPRFVIDAVEAVLANTVGATSARQMLTRLESDRQLGIHDLTALVGEAQRFLSFNRESLEAAVEHLSHGVSVVDSELRLVAWNSEYERMFDYPERFLFVGCPIERVYRFNAERGILSTSGRPLAEEIARRLSYMREGSAHQFERLMPDGRVLEIKGRPLPGGGFVTTFVDVSEYREMVTQLREVQDELQSRLASGEQALSERNAELRREVRARTEAEVTAREAFQSKAQFMAATSHDLLQPINAARLLGEVLRDNPADSRSLTQLLASLDRAQNMIEELREIARLDADDPEIMSEPLALSSLFERLSATFSKPAAAKGLKIRFQHTAMAVLSDERLLLRLLENLVSNAVKYTLEGGVLVGARRVGDCVKIVVLDTGPGIAAEDQARIFHEFERLEMAQQGAQDGLGLGLALVQRYARLLGVELHLQSAPGEGTCFSILLPRHAAVIASDTEPSTRQRNTDALSGTVLCIDNDRQLLVGLAALVGGFGLRTLSARNEVEARQALRDTTARPDLVIADYHLDNDVTGVDVVGALRETVGDVPVIVISANDDLDIRDTVRAGGYRFLPKPIEPQRLRTLIAALLEQRR
jgi:Na+/proline symporter/C4-dicarboxylate-specific signal transduction histidine kinase/CheY-like chemotaxis protein